MSSRMEHFSHPDHTLILYHIFFEELVVIEEDAACSDCKLPLIGTPAYTCTTHDVTFNYHKSCIEEEIYRCYGCDKTVLGFPTYICINTYGDEDCPYFLLHKTCASLPKQINHQMHKKHPLILVPRRQCMCNVCRRRWKLFTYTCEGCHFDVCVFCAFADRALAHEGHKKQRPEPQKGRQEHKLALEHREGRKERRLEHFSHPKHQLVLIPKEDDVIAEDATCHICNRSVIGTSTYTCTIDEIDCQNFYLHMSCAELPREFHLQNHKQHSVFLKPCPDCVCDICGVDVNFAYACGVCSSFTVCVFCASEDIRRTPVELQFFSESTPTIALEHFSHPKHALRPLKKYEVIGEDEICHLCNKPVIGSSTYTCTKDAFDCENFYLHKTCADLPMQLNHNLDKHPLRLMPRPHGSLCTVCACNVKYAYACDNCNINVCVFCGFEQRVIHHEGHHEHNLTLQRKALFKCDACSEKAEDYSYVCTPCDFWIHKSCAFTPSTIPTPAYHHHPLSLIYSVPEMHRYFSRYCAICFNLVERHHWLYYCHQCTFLVHIKCSTSKHPLTYMLVSTFINDSEPEQAELVQFPLSSEESLFDLIVTQCGKLQIDFQSEGANSSTTSTITDDPPIIEAHWSHPQHPLGLLQFTTEDDDDKYSDDRRVLICNGCIQPITVHRPCYYACLKCDFLLHSFCATKLPGVFPAEAFPSHPNHSLQIRMKDYIFVKCGTCNSATNGFYYKCETCDMTIDIRCAFLPSRIKHESHMHHSLVQCPPSNFICSVSRLRVIDRAGYECKSCNFTIDILCAFYPSRIKHKYDGNSHDITLRHPPFFYEGVFYCEICEEQVNNQWWLYHRGESDHSYHHNCLQWHENVKLGGSIVLDWENEEHKLAMVLKRTTRRNSPRYVCRICNQGYKCSFFFECDGCGLLVCPKCFIAILVDEFIKSELN